MCSARVGEKIRLSLSLSLDDMWKLRDVAGDECCDLNSIIETTRPRYKRERGPPEQFKCKE